MNINGLKLAVMREGLRSGYLSVFLEFNSKEIKKNKMASFMRNHLTLPTLSAVLRKYRFDVFYSYIYESRVLTFVTLAF